MSIFLQFIYRLSFGLALAMGLTSARLVPSGFFRVHLYVLLGLNALAALMTWQQPGHEQMWMPTALAALSYVGSVVWLYQANHAGKTVLWLVAILALAAGRGTAAANVESGTAEALVWLDRGTSGLLLGTTMAAMLLGHWYLNTPTMQLAPLKMLVALMGVAIAARAAVSAAGLLLDLNAEPGVVSGSLWFLVLRWTAGILGSLVVAVMTWQTLKIPNTQSATGILYVGVIVTFIGELTSQLLSRQALFPL